MRPIEIPGTDVTIHDVTQGNVERLEALLDLFVEAFPRYTRYLPIMRERAIRLPADADPRFVEHQWLAEVGTQAAGFTVFKYVPGRNCGLCMAIGVRPAYRLLSAGRYRRLSELLLKSSLEQLQADALTAGRPAPVGMVLEVEEPKLVARFREYGLVELPVDYREPPFLHGRQALADASELEAMGFQPMQLGIYPIGGESFNPSDPAMLANLIYALLVDHYRLPEEHWAVRRSLDSIQRLSDRGN